MEQNNNTRKPRLAVMAGCAASGKTTIVRHLAKMMRTTYVNKDDATRRLTDTTLMLHGLPPNDRENDFYIQYQGYFPRPPQGRFMHR